MQFNLKDATGTIVVYGFQDGQYEKWADVIKDGGTVTLTGAYEYYEKNSQHEVVKATIESYEDGVPPTDYDQVTVSEFITRANPASPWQRHCLPPSPASLKWKRPSPCSPSVRRTPFNWINNPTNNPKLGWAVSSSCRCNIFLQWKHLAFL